MVKRKAIFTNKEDVIYFISAKEVMSSMIPALLEIELDVDPDATFSLDPVFLPKDKYEITIVNETYVIEWEELQRKKHDLWFESKQEIYDYVISLNKEETDMHIINLQVDPKESLTGLEDSLFNSFLSLYGFYHENWFGSYKLIWYTEE